MSEKIFLKLIFYLFYSGRNPSFLEVWGCVCLCDPIGLHDKSVVYYLISVGFEIVAATVFCSAKAQFWMTSEAILIPKIHARLQEIASSFSKKIGVAPRTPPVLAFAALGSGLHSLTAPLSKILGSAPGDNTYSGRSYHVKQTSPTSHLPITTAAQSRYSAIGDNPFLWNNGKQHFKLCGLGRGYPVLVEIPKRHITGRFRAFCPSYRKPIE